MSAEQRLWHHVLLAILSALQSPSEQARQAQEFARRWVGQYPSKDFRMVCDFAELDPDCVHRHFKRIADMERFNGPRGARLIQTVLSVGLTLERQFAVHSCRSLINQVLRRGFRLASILSSRSS